MARRWPTSTSARDLALGFAPRTTLSLGADIGANFQYQARRTGELRQRSPAPAAAPGAQVFPGFQPMIAGPSGSISSTSRNNKSLYAEIASDISERFNIQARASLRGLFRLRVGSQLEAGRPSSSRSVWTCRFGRQPRPASAHLRCNSNSSNAAQATNNVAGVLLDTVTLPVDSPGSPGARREFCSIPSPPVQPVGRPGIHEIPRLDVTLDIDRVDIDDRILVTDNLQATAMRLAIPAPVGLPVPALPPDRRRDRRDPQRRRFPDTPRRRSSTQTAWTPGPAGWTAVATYRVPALLGGRLSVMAGHGEIKTKITKNAAAPGALSTIRNLVLFGRQDSLRLTEGQPRYKFNLSGDFERDWFGATFRATRYGEVLAGGTDRVRRRQAYAKTITDVERRANPLGYRLTLALGANNFFDIYPTNTPRGRGSTRCPA